MTVKKPIEGEIVLLIEPETDRQMRAQVMALLSVQFTARYMDGTDTMTFRFYHDHKETWL